MWVRRFLLVLLFCTGAVFAQSYFLERVEQDIFMQPDGSVRVEDTRTLRLEGDFRDNTYFIEIEPAPNGSVRFEGVEALDGKAPAVAQVTGNEIAWRVDAMNETRTFRFSYVLTSEVEVAEDAAQFDRFTLEREHAHVNEYALRVHPPAASPENFRVFMFTGLGRIGTLDFNEDFSTATVTLSPVSEGEFVRARVIVDAANFTVQTQEGPWLAAWLAEVERETQPFREESERRIQQERPVPMPPPPPPSPAWLVLLWGGVAALGFWFFRSYSAFGREPEVEDVGPYYREPAEEIPPAAVPYVITQSEPGLRVASQAIAATLLDFARRGYLQMQTLEAPRFLSMGRNETVYYGIVSEPTGLTPVEQDLWTAFKGAAQGTGAATFGGILEAFAGRDSSKPNSSPTVFDADDLRRYFEARPSFARGWISKPRRWYESTRGKLLDPQASRKALPIIAACFVGAALTGVLGLNLLGRSGTFFLHFLAATILLVIMGSVASHSLRRWNADKLLNARRWDAYRKFLSDFSLMREAPAEHYKLWDYHFVYATALGVSQQYLKNLQELMKLEPEKFSTPMWLAASRGSALNQVSALSNLESLSRSLNTLSQVEHNLRSLNSALSPKSSTGGGFGGSSSGGGSRGGGFGGGSRGGGSRSGMR